MVVSTEGKRLSADYLWVDDNTKEIKARGNVLFVDKGTSVEAAEIHLNLTTGIGSIFYGRVYNDLYSLRGQLIRKIGDSHFLTTEGEYTTCKDCPESWKLAAKNVDLTVDGYAYMQGVFVTINDIPTVYAPYLVVPVKTQRQTGLLFPQMSFASANHGSIFVQPLFLAIDKHQDATLGFGTYSRRGLRYEGEYRYNTYFGMRGTTNVYYQRDRIYSFASDRAAISTQHEWPVMKNFNVRWRYFDVKDTDYIYDFGDLSRFQNLPVMESNAVAQIPFDDFFVSVEARRYRNIFNDSPLGLDGGQVQATPTVHFGVKERNLVGPFQGSFYGRFDNFVRQNGAFNDANHNSVFEPSDTSDAATERLREARRYIFSPELSMPFRLGRYVALTPSAQFNQINYSFDLPKPNQPMPSTSTSYVRYRLEASTTIQKIFDYNGEKVSKVEHQLTPFVNLSYIPSIGKDKNHAFQRQVGLENGAFDEFDRVAFTNSTNFQRFPEGKSVYYGFTSKIVRKMRRPEELARPYPYDLIPTSVPKKYKPPLNRKQELAQENERLWDEFNPHYDQYNEVWTVNVSQAYDFIEARERHDDPKRAFSYLLARSAFSLDPFSHSLEYKYYPRLVYYPSGSKEEKVLKDEHEFTTSFTYTWKNLENLRRTRSFNRSISLNYADNSAPNSSHSIGSSLNWSFNDFINFTIAENYDLNAEKMVNWNSNLQLMHPSECWGLLFTYNWQRTRQTPSEFQFELQINLTGGGLVGAKSAASSGSAGLLGGG